MAKMSDRFSSEVNASKTTFKSVRKPINFMPYISFVISVVALLKAYHIF